MSNVLQQEDKKSPIFKKRTYRFGRQVIRIPVSKYSLNENVIHEYLPYILRLHSINVADYMHLDRVYRGDSNIWTKERYYGEKNKMNSIIEEGHPFSMVEFKKG